MIRKGHIMTLMLIVLLSCLGSCTKYYADDSSKKDITGSESESDYIWDSSDLTEIVLEGNSITVNSDNVSVDGCTVIIGKGGNYLVSGSLANGQIIVDTDDENVVRLILDGVNIACTGSSPVYIKSAVKVVIITSENTTNYISDGISTVVDSEGEPNAAIFSKSYLSFFGTGILIVDGNFNDGIAGKDGVVIKSGSITVTSADDGIRGKDYLKIWDGRITVNSGGDGLKSDNEEDTDKGCISIENGTFDITAGGDAIASMSALDISDGTFNITTGGGAAAVKGPGQPPPPGGGGTGGGYTGTVSAKGLKATSGLVISEGNFTVNSADDAIHSDKTVKIEGGILHLKTGDDAVHAAESISITSDTLDIKECFEGLESASITLQGGYVYVASSDDALNATMGSPSESDDGSILYIKGGDIFINTSGGDGIDSNGKVEMTGGTVIVHGPQSQPEVGIDVNGTFNISGGFLFVTGPNSGNMIEATSTSSSQYAAKITISSTLPASSLFHVEDAAGNSLITFSPVRPVYYVVISSPDLKNGSVYSVYTGGASSGSNLNGLYIDGTYSGGTLKKDFVISSKVTNVSF